MRLRQHLLAQLLQEHVFFGRADRREMTLHALERTLLAPPLWPLPKLIWLAITTW
jgi:hypothetical protein